MYFQWVRISELEPPPEMSIWLINENKKVEIDNKNKNMKHKISITD